MYMYMYIYIYIHTYIYIYIYIYIIYNIDNHKVDTLHVFFIILYRVIMVKKTTYLDEKYFRLKSLSIHFIYNLLIAKSF